MGTYREQLLKETYGRNSSQIYTQHSGEEAEPSRILTMFKLKFMIALLLFGGFVWLSFTGNSFAGVTADQIERAVTSQDFQLLMSESADF